MSEILPKLTERESGRLRVCTETILTALRGDFDAGLALIEVREKKLYREKWPTLEAYCLDVLKISQSRAYQLIDAAEVKESLPPSTAKLIINEAQARALVSVPENQRAKVVADAAKSGPITASSIAHVASKSSTIVEPIHSIKTGTSSKTPTEIKDAEQLDKEGWVIPPKIVQIWNHAEDESKSAQSLIVKLRTMFRDAEERKDPAYAEVKFQELIGLATNLFGNVKQIAPHGICTLCNGHPESQPKSFCNLCKGRGYLSAHAWKMYGDDRVKAVREKGKKS